jgi:hypothetical protein
MQWKVILILLALSVDAHADDHWDHNGSVVRLEKNGANWKFTYVEPVKGLPVTKGTLLFSGVQTGRRLSGTAYVFSTKCAPRSYSVSGSVEGVDVDVDVDVEDLLTEVTLSGQAPRLNADCQVVGYKADKLLFSRNGEMIVPAGPRAAEICATPGGSCQLSAPLQPGTRCWCPTSRGALGGVAN